MRIYPYKKCERSHFRENQGQFRDSPGMVVDSIWKDYLKEQQQARLHPRINPFANRQGSRE